MLNEQTAQLRKLNAQRFAEKATRAWRQRNSLHGKRSRLRRFGFGLSSRERLPYKGGVRPTSRPASPARTNSIKDLDRAETLVRLGSFSTSFGP